MKKNWMQSYVVSIPLGLLVLVALEAWAFAKRNRIKF